MNLIIGLGNPGEDYRRTRHNVGFMVVDALAGRFGIKIARRAGRSRVGRGEIEDTEVILARPETYMNNSGRAAAALLDLYGLETSDMLVVCDDFHLDLGVLRARAKGSSGGHKGLESIIDALGTREFARLRVGIGPPKGEAVEFVLREFRKNERPLVEEAVETAARACAVWVRDGMEACMSAFN